MSRHKLGSSFGASRRGGRTPSASKPSPSKTKQQTSSTSVGMGKSSASSTKSVSVYAQASMARDNRKKDEEGAHPQTSNSRVRQLEGLDEETQERIAELYEDLQEFKKAEHRYRESEHKSLEWEALKQYERTEKEIELLLNPPRQRRTQTPCLSMLCLPCLIITQWCLCVSTGRVGEYSKKKKITAAVTHELTQVGSDFTEKYIIGSKKLGSITRGISAASGRSSFEAQGNQRKNKPDKKPRLSRSGAAVDEYGYPLQWEGSVY
eukprot:g996.t1